MDCTHAAIDYTVSVVTSPYAQKLYLLHSSLLISAYFKTAKPISYQSIQNNKTNQLSININRKSQTLAGLSFCAQREAIVLHRQV